MWRLLADSFAELITLIDLSLFFEGGGSSISILWQPLNSPIVVSKMLLYKVHRSLMSQDDDSKK